MAELILTNSYLYLDPIFLPDLLDFIFLAGQQNSWVEAAKQTGKETVALGLVLVSIGCIFVLVATLADELSGDAARRRREEEERARRANEIQARRDNHPQEPPA